MSRPEELPSEIAVFPLTGAVLLPGGRLPLNVFEARYLAMVEDCMANHRMLGMIQPDRGTSGAAATPDDRPALYRVGCLGRLSSFSETNDGRFLVTLTGLVRFRVVRELAGRRGYRRVAAEYDGFLADLSAEPAAFPDRPLLLQALRAYFAANGFEANWDAVEQMPDDVLVVTLAMACPFEPVEKQALLEAASPAEQAGALLALLQMGSHGGDAGGPRA